MDNTDERVPVKTLRAELLTFDKNNKPIFINITPNAREVIVQ